MYIADSTSHNLTVHRLTPTTNNAALYSFISHFFPSPEEYHIPSFQSFLSLLLNLNSAEESSHAIFLRQSYSLSFCLSVLRPETDPKKELVFFRPEIGNIFTPDYKFNPDFANFLDQMCLCLPSYSHPFSPFLVSQYLSRGIAAIICPESDRQERRSSLTLLPPKNAIDL